SDLVPDAVLRDVPLHPSRVPAIAVAAFPDCRSHFVDRSWALLSGVPRDSRLPFNRFARVPFVPDRRGCWIQRALEFGSTPGLLACGIRSSAALVQFPRGSSLANAWPRGRVWC